MSDKIVFVVEDEENIREIIKCTLESFNYLVKDFENAEDFLIAIKNEKPNIILLDIMLPKSSGLDTLKIIRDTKETCNIPVILLTAKGSEADKVKGLDMGANDYITKPFGVLELAARIRANLRNIKIVDSKDLNFEFISGELRIYPLKREVYVSGIKKELTLKEYELLLLLVNNIERIVTRDEIFEKVWDINFQGETRTLDMHIKSLRQKLEDNQENPKYIKTIRGVGYTFLNGLK